MGYSSFWKAANQTYKKQEELEEQLSNFDGEMASSVSPFCRESHSPFFTIIDFPEKEERECHENNSKFVKKEERRLYEHYKLTYVDLLYKCELKTRRNEVLKFVLDPQKFFFNKEYALKGQFCHDNSQSSKLLIRNNKHSKLQCVICRIAVKGMFNLCFSCGHGGHTLHLLKWFETNSVCAGGCGCQCLRKDAFKL
ncbi:GATOR complex protein WDR59-like [Xenia sp. Carnegie-2017]|uniref:GATOR complex protein WDR59-like n=1 Tax=Xenia sp. Carnegie-2017 TaxID=2897299 RepID=UPI001F03FD2F|nr:GATOR complex protein WDR59-like [Xenia sp. Carnegie-2017]